LCTKNKKGEFYLKEGLPDGIDNYIKK